MSRTTIIYCDACGTKECGFNHTTLWERLHRKGWKKGPRVECMTTHFCDRERCREALEKLRLRESITRGSRYRPLRTHAHKEPGT